MSLDLILKDVDDIYIRENFVRIRAFTQDQAILRGQWAFYEIEFDRALDNFGYPHGLSFKPKDIIVTATSNGEAVIFNYDQFTSTNFNLTVSGPCTIRFFAGTYMET